MKAKLLSLLSITSFCLCGCNVSYDSKDYPIIPLAKYEMAKLDKDTMPISAWAGPDSSLGLNTFEQFKNAKDAGLNMMYAGLGDRIWGNESNLQDKRNNIYKSLEYAEQNDLLFFPCDTGFTYLEDEAAINYLSDAHYEDYSSFGGLMVCDEPMYYYIKELARLKELYYSYYSKDIAYYVNMNPCYVDDSYLNGHSYDGYLQDYIKDTDAEFFSYDFYPELGEAPYMRFDYYLNLVIASRISIAQNVPFWNFVLASSHEAGKTHYRLPSEHELYWQVSTSLAYGCKGFQYFCFMTPNNYEYLNHPGSIVNEHGERTEIFPYIQNCNKAIGYFDDVLINSTLVGFKTDGEIYPKAFSPFTNENNDTRDIKGFATTNGGIVSTFAYGNKTAYLLVNTNYELSSKLAVSFNRGITGEVTYFNGEKANFRSPSLSVTLKPGQCALLEVTN